MRLRLAALRYLQHAVALLLAFIGVKIVLDVVFKLTIPTAVSLAVIGSVLALGVLRRARCSGRHAAAACRLIRC